MRLVANGQDRNGLQLEKIGPWLISYIFFNIFPFFWEESLKTDDYGLFSP